MSISPPEKRLSLNNMRKYRNQLIVGIIFTSAVAVIVALISNVGELAEKLSDFPLWLLIPIIVMKLVNWTMSYMEWHYFLHVIHVYPVFRGTTQPAIPPDQPATIRVSDSLILWVASLPLALSPGKVAEILKAIILKSMNQTPISRSSPIIIAERLVDGIAVVTLVGISALVASDHIFISDDVSANYIRGILIGITIIMILLISVIQFRKAAYWLINLLTTIPFFQRYTNEIRAIYDSSYHLAKIRHLLPTTFFGITAYFTDCIGFYIMLIGLGETPSVRLFAQATFILGFSVVISAVSALPGGAGGREVTVGAFLTNVVGMSSAATGAAVLMIGVFQIWFGTLVGIIVGLIFRKRLFPPNLEAEIEAYEHQHNDKTMPQPSL